MKTVALVTYTGHPKLTPSDQLLVDPFQKLGIRAVAVAWDDPKADWKQFDAVILRSCWNYHHKYDTFTRWLTDLEQMNTRVINPITIIRWNSQKTYLQDLEKRGVPIIPSLFIPKSTHVNLSALMSEHHWTDIVVKPTIGASSDGIFRVQSRVNPLTQMKLDTQLKQSGVIIQQTTPEIFKAGEFSIVIIAGAYSHAVQKIPKKGDFRSQSDFGAITIAVTPEKHIRNQAETIVNHMGTDVLYARVDGIIRGDQFLLMELELIEPELGFNYYPPAAAAFARAVAAMI